MRIYTSNRSKIQLRNYPPKRAEASVYYNQLQVVTWVQVPPRLHIESRVSAMFLRTIGNTLDFAQGLFGDSHKSCPWLESYDWSGAPIQWAEQTKDIMLRKCLCRRFQEFALSSLYGKPYLSLLDICVYDNKIQLKQR